MKIDRIHAELAKSGYGEQLKALQYRYHNPQTDRHEGGIVVSDAITRRSGSFMFR